MTTLLHRILCRRCRDGASTAVVGGVRHHFPAPRRDPALRDFVGVILTRA